MEKKSQHKHNWTELYQITSGCNDSFTAPKYLLVQRNCKYPPCGKVEVVSRRIYGYG